MLPHNDPTLSLPPAQLTLDPKTANAQLKLSEDCTAVGWGKSGQDLPSNPERFKGHPCVLGSRGFTSGWHSWEVEICGPGVCAIGVAKASVQRESCFPLEPEAGVWALRHSRHKYSPVTLPDATPLIPCSVPHRIRICLDCQEGKVLFLDAGSKAQIFAFPRAAFKGETIYPWFLVREDACLKLFPPDM